VRSGSNLISDEHSDANKLNVVESIAVVHSVKHWIALSELPVEL
jgi:hypothetical protein